MNKPSFNKEKIINYWIESADEDYETMLAMYDSKRLSWTLFVGHLEIEKLLKAYYIKVNSDYPPFIHNLLRLAEKSKIELNEEDKLFFTTVTAFNINARYDDYKMSFHKKCTPEYTKYWMERIKDKKKWIERQIKS